MEMKDLLLEKKVDTVWLLRWFVEIIFSTTGDGFFVWNIFYKKKSQNR